MIRFDLQLARKPGMSMFPIVIFMRCVIQWHSTKSNTNCQIEYLEMFLINFHVSKLCFTLTNKYCGESLKFWVVFQTDFKLHLIRAATLVQHFAVHFSLYRTIHFQSLNSGLLLRSYLSASTAAIIISETKFIYDVNHFVIYDIDSWLVIT